MNRERKTINSDLSRRIAGLSPEKRRLLEKKLGRSPSHQTPAVEDAIAVIGMGCRFPGGAHNPERFWQLLIEGRDAVGEVPARRHEWFRKNEFGPDEMDRILRVGGFIDRVAEFDAAFFNISPREAQQMDPQQRLLLMTAWEALESAGQPVAGLAGSETGVFIGIHNQSSEYYWLQIADGAAVDTYTATGGAHSIVANRLSYILDLNGPSLAVDTACSSSLVALHLACQSLRNQECETAIAGGVNLMLSPETSMTFSRLEFLSPDGRCKTFDTNANGFVRGEGCGVVVLRRYADAIHRKDPILALIRGSAVNQDGATNGLTAPNGPAQQRVIRQALSNAGVKPAAITFVETHGTGTVLGDPIEVEAIAAVLPRNAETRAVCWLGAVKSNIGHLEAAAGIAGVIKMVLCLTHRFIPPNINFKTLNPHIDLSHTRLAIPQKGKKWESGDEQLCGGVSSFGFGGTNAHMIIQEAPTVSSKSGTGGRQALLLPISARSSEALSKLAVNWQHFFNERDQREIPNIAYSAAIHRDHHDFRMALVGRSQLQMQAGLEVFCTGKSSADAMWSNGPVALPAQGPVFIYGGQGPQWYAMGRQLLAAEPVFQQTVQQCADLLGQFAEWSLMTELMANEGHSRLDQTEIAQPAIFALQMGLTALWKSWGIDPGAVVGHSLGEVAAACAAGVLSLEQALRVVYHRGRLLQGCTGKGRMAAVALSLEEAQRLTASVGRDICIAAVNGPTALTLSGSTDSLEALLKQLDARKVSYRPLKVNYAFHSSQVAPYQAALTGAIGDLTCRLPSVTAVSTVTGREWRENDFGREYWAKNIRQPVRFWSALDTLIQFGHRTFLEIGPHPVLAVAVAQCLEHRAAQGQVIASLRRDEEEQTTMLRSLGRLYCLGYHVEWKRLYPDGRYQALPLYPWNKRRYWAVSKTIRMRGRRKGVGAVADATRPYGTLTRFRSPLIQDAVVFDLRLDVASHPMLAEHRLLDHSVLPAAAYIEVVLSAASEAFGREFEGLSNLCIKRSLFLEEDNPQRIQVILKRNQNDAVDFEVVRPEYNSASNPEWILLASGRVDRLSATKVPTKRQPPLDIPDKEGVVGQRFYEQLAQRGIELGPHSRCIEAYWINGEEVTARLRLDKASSAKAGDGRLTPVLVDACLQTAVMLEDGRSAKDLFIAEGLDQFNQYGNGENTMICHARLRSAPAPHNERLIVDVLLCRTNGEPAAELKGVRLRRVDSETLLRGAGRQVETALMELKWHETDSVPTEQPIDLKGEWIAFVDHAEMQAALSKQIEKLGGRCLCIAPGRTHSKADEHLTMDPENSEHFTGMLHDWIGTAQANVRGILYLWGFGANKAQADSPAEAAHTSTIGLLNLVQALTKEIGSNGTPLWIVTQGAQVLDATETPHLAQAPLWGLGRVIAAEHPDNLGGLVDLDPASTRENAARELLTCINDPQQPRQIIIRQGRRYEPGLATTASRPMEPLDPLATYLIVGGLGGLGLQTAEWMVAQGARRLVLAARTPLPDCAEWQHVSTDHPDFNRIRSIHTMESAGAVVKTASLDMADEIKVRRLLSNLASDGWPPIKGVIHAAAVVHDVLLNRMKRDQLKDVFRPKLKSAWLLHQLLGKQPLDFMIYFSSMGALLGQPGQGGYAAANAFLDALAHYRHAKGQPALSINWGSWRGSGLAITEGGLRTIRNLARMGIETMAVETATEALGRLMRSGFNQVVVTDIDPERLRYTDADGTILMLEDLAGQTAAAELFEAGRPGVGMQDVLDAAESDAERSEIIEAEVKDMLATVLKMDADEIDPDIPFGNLGLDSLTAVELKNYCENRTGFTLSTTLAWNYPTARELAAHLAEKLGIGLIGDESSRPTGNGGLESSNWRPDVAAMGPAAENLLEEVDQLSDEEALHQLLGKDRP